LFNAAAAVHLALARQLPFERCREKKKEKESTLVYPVETDLRGKISYKVEKKAPKFILPLSVHN
jgi:hypothetical protein